MTDHTGEDVAAVFEEIGDLEKEFAQVELDARTQPPPALFKAFSIFASLCALTGSIST